MSGKGEEACRYCMFFDADVVKKWLERARNGVAGRGDVDPLLHIRRKGKLRIGMPHGARKERDGRTHGDKAFDGNTGVKAALLAEAHYIVETDDRAKRMGHYDDVLALVGSRVFANVLECEDARDISIDAAKNIHGASLVITFVFNVLHDLDAEWVDGFCEVPPE